MKLKCRIHEKEYDIVSGATFSEEYNETLDSGSITLDHIEKIKGLKPYDDVYIWNADEDFVGYYNIGDEFSADALGGSITAELANVEGDESDWKKRTSDISIRKKRGYFYLSDVPINIWASLLIEELGNVRWKIERLPFEFSLSDTSAPSSAPIIGYYKIGLSRDDVVLDRYLVFYKDDSFEQDEGLPPYLFIPFEARVPQYSPPDLALDDASLTLKNQAIETLDEGARGRVFSIKSIARPKSESNYSFFENVGAQTKINMRIRGLSDSEVLNLKSLKMKVSVYGQTIDLRLKTIASQAPESVTMTFMASDSSQASFSIALSKADEGVWIGEKEFLITLAGGGGFTVVRYGDKILNDVNDGAIVSIATSQQQILPKFFKHLLVDSFTCEMVDLDSENYKYKIDLMSETKRLEKIVLPNISITQPIAGRKRSIWYYLNQYVSLYSPKIKMVSENGGWEYRNKFKIDPRSPGDRGLDDEYLTIPAHEIFDDAIYAPELSLTAPTLREVLSRLMIVRDCIPVVKNDVIYAMRISETHGMFVTDRNHFSFISESMNSANYSTSFRREYGGAISQKNSTHMVEFLGFRNRSEALMTVDNMRLETRFPIYKINKLYMCYYKAFKIYNTETRKTYSKLILVKQDISRLVLQNAVRDALPADWTKLPLGAWSDLTTEQMSKYRILTLGYEIGSNVISGWGEKYSYISDILGWTKATYTYIETIMSLIDRKYPYGEGQLQFLEANEELSQGYDIGWKNCMVTPNNSSNVTDKLKSLFFQMDYIGMYSGAVVHSKDNTEDDGIQTSDNCSSALSILEVDGLFEKEKANRIGNSEIGFIARFSDVSEMNETYNDILGSKWDKDESVVVFHREFSIYDDCVLANFAGTKDYVLKNYFTTVFAKYRTYSYASYAESVNRTENDRYLVTLSDDSCLYEIGASANQLLNIESIISAFSESVLDESLAIRFPKQINGGYFTFEDGKSYFSDVNQFVCGHSLCFNIRTFDSITNGNFISSLNCYDAQSGSNRVYVGSQQDWYKMPVDENDGFLERMGCYFGHFEDSDILSSNVAWKGTSSEISSLFGKIFKMPLKQRTPTFSFGKEYDFCKDDKEIIDYTLQYELINDDDDLLFSEWLMKLTNFNDYAKFSTERAVLDSESSKSKFNAYFGSAFVNWNAGLLIFGNSGNTYKRQIRIRVEKETAESTLTAGLQLSDCYSKQGYAASYFSPSSDFGGGSWTTITIFIRLFQIAEVVRDANDEITALKIRAYYEENSISTGAFIYHSGMSGNTATLTFEKRGSGEDGWYEFYYEGQDCPGQPWEVQVAIDNGVDASDADAVSGGVVTSAKYFTFPQTMYVIKSTKKMERSLTYEQYRPGELPSHMTSIPLSPKEADDGKTFEDIFEIAADSDGRPYIEFKANDLLGDDYESVQYWYYDAKGDGYLHFVFGINRTKEQGSAKAYISLVKNRNKTVYNALHREAGKVMNFASESNKGKYGKQLYEKKAGE